MRENKGSLFANLKNIVSREVLDLIVDEVHREKEIGLVTKEDCGCQLRRSHGILCVCELFILAQVGAFILKESDLRHWFQLSTVPVSSSASHVSIDLQLTLDMVINKFGMTIEAGKHPLLLKLLELAHPESTLLEESGRGYIPKGKQKSQKKCGVNTSNKRDPSNWERILGTQESVMKTYKKARLNDVAAKKKKSIPQKLMSLRGVSNNDMVASSSIVKARETGTQEEDPTLLLSGLDLMLKFLE
ncbi:hypothetical protein GIB67_003682 [Kingdonia uniflora]|uniref:Uncharacterized protein n=1 Tax=Kingdonia uniflora TaxID=39325 RepID=A0A7J7M429_9MAGN|nr:hypothetical protein GIB67_003682 [Kingdonia uniflora]